MRVSQLLSSLKHRQPKEPLDMSTNPKDLIAKLASAPSLIKCGRETYQLTDAQVDQMRKSMLLPVFKMVKTLFNQFEIKTRQDAGAENDDIESVHATLLRDTLGLYVKVNRLKEMEETRIVNAMTPPPECHYYSDLDVNHFVMSCVGFLLAGYDEDDISEIDEPIEATVVCQFLNAFLLADRAGQAAFSLFELLLEAEEGCVGPASFAQEAQNHLDLYQY